MLISIPNQPPPPPPTPQEIIDAANQAINDLTGGGSSGGGSSVGGATRVPAPPAPYVPVPFPVAFGEEVSHAAEIAAGTASTFGQGASNFAINIFGAPPQGRGRGISAPEHTLSTVTRTVIRHVPRKRLPAGQNTGHRLSLAVQAIAIVVHRGAIPQQALLSAIVTFIAIVLAPTKPGAHAAGAAVVRAISAILKQFSLPAHAKAQRVNIHALSAAFQSAVAPGLFRANALARLSAPEHAARRQLIAALSHLPKRG